MYPSKVVTTVEIEIIEVAPIIFLVTDDDIGELIITDYC